MNIFYLHKCVNKCAKYHVDKHVVKMILEYCQLLSTAHRVIDGKEIMTKSKTGKNVKRWILNNELNELIYSATHINHPSAIWVRESSLNYEWLHELLKELCKEYTYRYGKIHKSESSGLVKILEDKPKSILHGNFTEPALAMPNECKVEGNALQSYRNYYLMKKQHIATWHGKLNMSKDQIPSWFQFTT